MSVTEFKRGVPTYKDKDNNEYGLLCETKEVCVTDNDGVSLEYKLQTLMQNIASLTSELQLCAKESDLSNYLPKSGGTVNGNIMVSKNGAGLVSVEDTANGRQIGLLTSGGKCGLYDYTNSKWVLENIANGTNTFNGTASGNLPLNGEGTVRRIYIKNVNTGNGDIRKLDGEDFDYGFYFTDKSRNGKTSSLRVYSDQDKAYFVDNASKNQELLHAGNSAKVVVSETAPSDTSALWVW